MIYTNKTKTVKYDIYEYMPGLYSFTILDKNGHIRHCGVKTVMKSEKEVLEKIKELYGEVYEVN